MEGDLENNYPKKISDLIWEFLQEVEKNGLWKPTHVRLNPLDYDRLRLEIQEWDRGGSDEKKIHGLIIDIDKDEPVGSGTFLIKHDDASSPGPDEVV